MGSLVQSRRGSFGAAISAAALFVFIFLVAFMTEDKSITGFAVDGQNSGSVITQHLMEFDDVSSLGSLNPGNYFITGDGVVYWTDNGPVPAARVKSLHESQKNRKIYIDVHGNVGYLTE